MPKKGRRSTKRAPPPSASSRTTAPPWASATALHDGQPEAAAGAPAGVAAAPREALEDLGRAAPRAPPGRGRRPPGRQLPPSPQTDTVTGVPFGVLGQGVLDQVQLPLGAGRRARPETLSSARCVECVLVLDCQRARPRRRPPRATVEMSTLRARRLAPGVGAGQEQQVGHQAAHASRRAQRGPSATLACSPLEPGLEQLEVGQDAGQRGAQLVGGVGHELARRGQRGLGLRAGGAQLAEHVLERVGQVGHLVVGRGAWAGVVEGSRVRATSRAPAVRRGERGASLAGPRASPARKASAVPPSTPKPRKALMRAMVEVRPPPRGLRRTARSPTGSVEAVGPAWGPEAPSAHVAPPSRGREATSEAADVPEVRRWVAPRVLAVQGRRADHRGWSGPALSDLGAPPAHAVAEQVPRAPWARGAGGSAVGQAGRGRPQLGVEARVQPLAR